MNNDPANTKVLDLCLTLTPPPPSADPDQSLAHFMVGCEALGLTNYTGGGIADLLTTAERAELNWYLEEYWQWPFAEFAKRGKQAEVLLTDLGKRLYRVVFSNPEARDILQAWRFYSEDGCRKQISIVSEVPAALSLPWELLHDEQGFLVMRARSPISIIRRLPQREAAALAQSFELPLRVLLVTARPDGVGFIDPRGIARELLDEVQDQIEQGQLALEFLRPPTLAALRERLSHDPPIHILHFDGHGAFAEEKVTQDSLLLSGQAGQGVLAFETADGKLDLVPAEQLGGVLNGSGVQLAVLTACQSAVGSADNAFSSVAARLIKSGVTAVSAMSASLLVASATRYVEAFYHALANGDAVPTAQERARQKLHDDPKRHVHRRRKDEPGEPIELVDWWLPHYYQQRPLVFQTKKRSHKVKPTNLPRLNEEMPGQPRYGFSGRARELLQVERWLLHNKLVVVHGFGGVGKTALSREAADWFTQTGMYQAACFVPFEQRNYGGDSATPLSRLGHFLGAYDSTYNPDQPAAALAKLRPALLKRPTLIIADNLESLLPEGEAPLDTGTRTQLWTTLLDLAKCKGAGVLLTTRSLAFGDGRLSPGLGVSHLPLRGLHPEEAYALASRLLESLQIERERAPYPELRDLLVQLDHHPLAIQLVLPNLREVPIARLRTEFAGLLPKFMDQVEEGRNRSLLASLEYSLRRLSSEQRARLPCLALFEGGASEDDLLKITEIPEGEWRQLRPALEEAALLSAEQVHPAIPAPYLRFHPVLAPYLRTLPTEADDPALRDRYVGRYYALSNYLYSEDNRNPEAVRALVQKEMPNLRRTLDFLLAGHEAEDRDRAVNMADRIAWFLAYFGQKRELEEMRRKINALMETSPVAPAGNLSQAEWLHQSGLGEDEFNQGKLQAAYQRFTLLLERIESQPPGVALGPGSYQHCQTLGRLARCLQVRGQPGMAEECLQRALQVIEALLVQRPSDKDYLRQRGLVLTELGDVLTDQGRYSEARTAYEQGLQVAQQQNDKRGQGVTLGQVGTLALLQKEYGESKRRHEEALALFQELDEPAMEAVAWHQLGMVAEKQKAWDEAGRCYRESLSLKEQLGDAARAASTCNQLAIVAKGAGRPAEAEGWYLRALELDERLGNEKEIARDLNNLAGLLLDEVQAGRANTGRLAEARGYAERALIIREKLDVSSEIWKTLNILARIAELEGRTEQAKAYRRRERETYAAFPGNRYHIDNDFGPLIADIVAAAKGNVQTKAQVEERLLRLEANGWHIEKAVRRIWAGERDWHSLCETLDRQDSLIIKRVLEELGRS